MSVNLFEFRDSSIKHNFNLPSHCTMQIHLESRHRHNNAISNVLRAESFYFAGEKAKQKHWKFNVNVKEREESRAVKWQSTEKSY